MQHEWHQPRTRISTQMLRFILVCLMTLVGQAVSANTELQKTVDALSHSSPEKRTEAASALYDSGTTAKAALPDLITALRKESDAGVRHRMVWAISAVGEGQSSAVPPLAEVLAKDLNAGVRTAAAQAIGSLGLAPEVSVPALIEAMADPDVEVRKESMIALSLRPFVGMAPKSVPALVAALSDKSTDMWSSAADALGNIGPDAAAAVPTLRKMTADENWWKRRSATTALGKIGAKAALAELQHMLIDPVPQVRIEAAIALISMGEVESTAMKQIMTTLNLPMGLELGPEGQANAHMVMRAAWAVGAFARHAPSRAIKSLALLAVYPKNLNLNITSRAALLKQLNFFAVHPEALSREDLVQAKATLTNSGKKDLLTELAKIDEVLEISEALEAKKRHTYIVITISAGIILVAVVASLQKVRRNRNSTKGAKENPNPRVFLCYNRIDSSALCGRIYDRLSALWGKENVFRDVDSSNPGELFPQRMQECIRGCDAVIVIMGGRWTEERLPETLRLFGMPECSVRDEIAFTLAEEKFLIPVLHDGARMPSSRLLPSQISQLANLTALPLSERHFDIEISGLVELILNQRSSAARASQQV